jgi:uncharacterized protein YecT (DUF1311 family)
MRMMALGLLLAAVGSSSAIAAGAPLYKQRDCNRETVQSAMNECSGANLDAANAELSRVYNKLMAQQTDQPSKDQLKDVEGTWVAYRNKECVFEIGPQAQGGSIWPLEMNTCLQSKTDARIREIRATLGCVDNPAACTK